MQPWIPTLTKLENRWVLEKRKKRNLSWGWHNVLWTSIEAKSLAPVTYREVRRRCVNNRQTDESWKAVGARCQASLATIGMFLWSKKVKNFHLLEKAHRMTHVDITPRRMNFPLCLDGLRSVGIIFAAVNTIHLLSLGRLLSARWNFLLLLYCFLTSCITKYVDRYS